MRLKSYKYQLEINLIDLRFFLNQNIDSALSSLTGMLEKYENHPEIQSVVLCFRGAVSLFRNESRYLAITDWVSGLGKGREKYQAIFLHTFLTRTTLMVNRKRTILLFKRLISPMKNGEASNSFQNIIQKKFIKELDTLFSAFKSITSKYDNNSSNGSGKINESQKSSGSKQVNGSQNSSNGSRQVNGSQNSANGSRQINGSQNSSNGPRQNNVSQKRKDRFDMAVTPAAKRQNTNQLMPNNASVQRAYNSCNQISGPNQTGRSDQQNQIK